MKNAHGVEPSPFLKGKRCNRAISCKYNCGPIFFDDIYINDNCNRKNSCWVYKGISIYGCNPHSKSSLFLNTNEVDNKNYFTLLDYEVFGVDYENRDNINKLCKHPDIIMEYIETKDISEESLKQFDDDTELLSDLDAILCNDSAIRLKISRYYFKNPSLMLTDTQIVNQQYDSYLRKWVGDYKWKLLYRASEHDYTGKSFHEYCNDKGPTLVIIKSSGGWIFGGYTTQSWSGYGIYNDMIY